MAFDGFALNDVVIDDDEDDENDDDDDDVHFYST